MLAKITLYDGTIYRIADKTTDTQDGLYLGRIKDELSLVSAMQEAGNAPATINLTIINHDDFIPHSKDLWAAELLLTNDNGVSWRGKINFCNFDADGNLYVTASEKTAPELELQLPDEVRQVYTIDEDFHQSSVTMTIPLVVGGTTSNPILLPTILIDKTEGVYLICVGEIRSVVKVYNGTEELPNTAYTAYTGTSSQAEHAGFAYVKINEDYRLNADGSYAEINVEVVGLKLANFTEEECRNGALFLYYFLTTAATGVNGWGCGIDPSEIDTASFRSAITLCNQLGYKLDGIMWLRQSAQSWIDQICQAIHGKYSINANGKRSLFIDYAGNASKKTFTASNMQVDKYGKNSYTSVVYNKGILSYDYNPITGLFMQSAQYENAESIAQIGEQKFVGESYLLKDPTTALAVLEYTCKRSQTAAEAIEFKTDDINTVLRAGDVITINRPDLSINNALYQIQNISITDYEASISAVKFDTSVFIVSGTPSSVNWGNEKQITPALTPAQATNLLLSTGFDINPDGTGTPYISGTFTVPDGGWLAAAVQYGIGANPNNWTELALITEGRFKISPVNVGTVYSVRIRMITATGHSDYLRGQITATGDTVPPSEPTIAAKATDRTVTVQCGLDNPPYDMGGFQIYRKKSTEQVYTYIGSIAANRGYASFSDYVDEYVTYNYQAKSYDRSGNLSTNFSNVASVTVTGIQANDVAATALAMPTGSILRLSAKNCTTASIAEANGVKDVSGNSNHGQATANVSVVTDDEKGDVFNFASGNNYLNFNVTSSPSLITKIKTTGELTYAFWFKTENTTINRSSVFSISSNNAAYGIHCLMVGANGAVRLINRLANNDFSFAINGLSGHNDGKWHFAVLTLDFVNNIAKIFVDAMLESEVNNSTLIVSSLANASIIRIGTAFNNGSVYGYVGEVFDPRIYLRALSASEIKTLYMFPDDVTFGQMTADLIGANIIKASNLVLTENIITQTAQIKDAIITNAKISDLNASKINAGTLDAARIAANAITAEKLNVAALKAPSGCICYINAQGMAAGVYSSGTVADSSGHQRKANIRGSVQIYDKNVSVPAFFTWKNGQQGSLWTEQEVWGSHYLTFEVWLFPTNYTDTSNHAIVSNYPNALHTSGICLYQNKLKLRAYVKDDYGPNECDISLTAAALTQVVLEYNAQSGSLTWFVNGVQRNTIASDANKQTMSTANANIIINAPLYNNYYAQNEIVSVRVYKRILSATEIKTLYMLGTDTESGQITADRIATDAIKSRNYAYSSGLFSTAGTFLDLSNGALTSKNLAINSSGNIYMKAHLEAYGVSSDEECILVPNNYSKYGIKVQSQYNNSSSIAVYASNSYGIGILGSGSGTDNVGVKGYSYGGYGGWFETTSPSQYALRAEGYGANYYGLYVKGQVNVNGTIVHGSDENIKSEIKDVSVLEKLKKIRVKSWKYDDEKIAQKEYAEQLEKYNKGEITEKPELKARNTKSLNDVPLHIGAMAAEFNEAFRTSNYSKDYISYTDEIGVCMRAIQELAEISDAQRIEIDSQKAEIAKLKAKLKIQQDEKLDVEQKEPTSKENLQVENDDTEPITEPVGNSEQLKDGGESEEKK